MDESHVGKRAGRAPVRERRLLWLFLGGALLGGVGGCFLLTRLGIVPTFQEDVVRDGAAAARAEREWATPLNRPGLPNLHRVSDDLYRGEQPTDEGFAQLAAMGVRTVVNLRSFHGESDEVKQAGMGYEHIYMKAWHPEDEDLVRFLRVVTDKARTPVFVHCKHGSDRTGTMCGVYRIAVCGWGKSEALAEMQHGGFGFHGVWGNLVEYIEKLDVAEIRRGAGLPATMPD